MTEICGHGPHREARDPYDMQHMDQYQDEYSLVLPSNIIQAFSGMPVHFSSSVEADSPPEDDSSTYTWSAPGSSGSPAPQSELHSFNQAMEIRSDRGADYPPYSFPSMAFNPPLPSTYVNPPPYSGTTMPPPPRPQSYRAMTLDYPSHAHHSDPAYQASPVLLQQDQEDHYHKQRQTLHHQQQQQHSARCLTAGPWRLGSMPAEVIFEILSFLWQDLKWAAILHLRGTNRRLRSVVIAWEASMNPEELRLGKDCYIMEMERDCPRFYPLTSNRAGPPARRPSKGRGRDVVDEGTRWLKPRITGGLGCYCCHSIRLPDAFEKSSLMPEVDPDEKAAKAKRKGKDGKGRGKGRGKKGVATSASSSPISAASEDFITTTYPSSPTDLSAASSRGQSPPSLAGGRRPNFATKVRSRDRMPNTRRYCIDCGIKLGFYRPGDLIYNVPGRRTWVCSCLVVQYNPENPCHVCKDKPPLSQKEPETTGATGSFSAAKEHSVGYHSPQ